MTKTEAYKLLAFELRYQGLLAITATQLEMCVTNPAFARQAYPRIPADKWEQLDIAACALLTGDYTVTHAEMRERFECDSDDSDDHECPNCGHRF